MPFNKPVIRAGVLGLGMGQNMFLAHDMPESTIKVHGICDTNEERLESMRAEHTVPFATTDWREMIQRDDIDLIGVFTPDGLHAEHVLAALEAGKHVICTKPMTDSLDDAVAILEAVRRTGLTFLVGQTCRFSPHRRAAKQLVDAGRYGKLVYVEATYSHDIREVLDGTAWRYEMPQDFLYGGLCHPMDLALWIGGRPAEISAMASRADLDPRYPEGLDTNYLVNIRFENGAIGRVIGLYDFIHPEGMPYIELTVSGSEAASHEDQITWHGDHTDRRVEPIGEAIDERHEGVDYSGHRGEVAEYLVHFEQCLRSSTEPSPGALEATQVISTLDAVRRSAALNGAAVDVRWDF
jgi:predicted dehydrogenase